MSEKAPAFVRELAFSRARPEEMVRVDYEMVQPDGAGPALYHYVGARHGCACGACASFGIARRFWALEGRLLVGGTIRDASDMMHLVSAFGVTHVLSFESEHSDENVWRDARRGAAPFPDDGKPPPLGPMVQAVRWVKDLPPEAVLYCHCRLGFSRGPTAAYLALRARHHMSRESAQKYAGRRQGGEQLLHNYLAVVDEAVRLVTGRSVSE